MNLMNVELDEISEDKLQQKRDLTNKKEIMELAKELYSQLGRKKKQNEPTLKRSQSNILDYIITNNEFSLNY